MKKITTGKTKVWIVYDLFIKAISGICESKPGTQGGMPCIKGTRFTLNEIEGAVKDFKL